MTPPLACKPECRTSGGGEHTRKETAQSIITKMRLHLEGSHTLTGYRSPPRDAVAGSGHKRGVSVRAAKHSVTQ